LLATKGARAREACNRLHSGRDQAPTRQWGQCTAPRPCCLPPVATPAREGPRMAMEGAGQTAALGSHSVMDALERLNRIRFRPRFVARDRAVLPAPGTRTPVVMVSDGACVSVRGVVATDCDGAPPCAGPGEEEGREGGQEGRQVCQPPVCVGAQELPHRRGDQGKCNTLDNTQQAHTYESAPCWPCTRSRVSVLAGGRPRARPLRDDHEGMPAVAALA
jgi:hypothetical protein